MNHYKSNNGLYRLILTTKRTVKYYRKKYSGRIVESFYLDYRNERHIFQVTTMIESLRPSYTVTVEPWGQLGLLNYLNTELSDTKLEKIFRQFQGPKSTLKEYDGATLYTVEYKSKLYHMELNRGDLYATFGNEIYSELNKYLKR